MGGGGGGKKKKPDYKRNDVRTQDETEKKINSFIWVRIQYF